MQMSDKQNITIQLAGQPKIPLAIDRDDEELMRRAEKMVNDLWNRWSSQTFAAEPQLKVMARVAYQFAVLYLKADREAESLKKLEQYLDEVLKASADPSATV